jgi:hypothetical protein
VTKFMGPHVAWAEIDGATGAFSVFYSRFFDEAWTSPEAVAGPIVAAGPPMVSINTTDVEGRLLITWLDELSPLPGLYGRVWNLTEWEDAVPMFETFGGRAVIDHGPSIWELHVASHTIQPTCPCNSVLHASGGPGAWSDPESIGGGHTDEPWEWPQEVSLHVDGLNRSHVIWRHESYDSAFSLVDERLVYAVGDGEWDFDLTLAAGRNAHQPMVGTRPTGEPAVVWCDDADGVFDVYLATPEPLVAAPGGNVPPRPMVAVRPNPTRGATGIAVELTRASGLTVRLYDGAGRLVAVLGEARHGPGVARLEWAGRDLAGRKVPAGVYYLDVRAGAESASRRVVVVR